MTVHRDAYDPSKGITSAAKHFITEAPSAKLAMGAGAGFLAYRAVRRWLLGCVIMVSACLPINEPINPTPPADICWNDYAGLVVGMAIDLAQSCKPVPVEQCGSVPDRVIERWQPKFDAWERRCAEKKTEA